MIDKKTLENITTVIRPSLRFVDLTVIVVSLVIGMGIFRTPAEVAQKAGSYEVFILAWVTGAIVSMIGAFIFAEVGSAYPRAGGFYQIFSHCYHPAFAFMVNWITVMSNAASTALVAVMGSEYLAPLLFPEWNHDMTVGLISALSVLILYFVNMAGIKVSAKILTVLMVVKISLLLIMMISIFVLPEQLESSGVARTGDMGWIQAFGLCFIPVFFTYGGYQQTMNFGGDVKVAQRTMPRAIIVGMLLVMVIYLMVNYAYVHALGLSGLASSKTIAADINVLLFGEKILPWISVIMFISVLAYVNVSVMSNPRIYYAMAQDGVMPATFMKVNSRTQVQQSALTLFVIFILITLYFSRSIGDLLKFVMFFDSIAFMAAAYSIFIFRRRATTSQKDLFRMRGYPWLPMFFISVYAIISGVIFYHDPTTALTGFVLFLGGFPLYKLFVSINGNKKE